MRQSIRVRNRIQPMTLRDLFEQLIHVDLFEFLKGALHGALIGLCVGVTIVGGFILLLWILLMS